MHPLKISDRGWEEIRKGGWCGGQGIFQECPKVVEGEREERWMVWKGVSSRNEAQYMGIEEGKMMWEYEIYKECATVDGGRPDG